MDNFRDSLIIRSEITVKSLMTKMLSRWRSILLCGLLMSILAGSYNYYSQRKAVLQWKEPADTSAESAGSSIPDYTNVRERTLRAIYDKSNYFDNSLYLRLNPSDYWLAAVEIYVITEESEENTEELNGIILQSDTTALLKNRRILDHYGQFISHGIDYEELASEFNTTGPYIKEMVNNGTQDRDVCRIMLSSYYFNQEGAEKILDYLIEKIKDHQEEAATLLGEHELLIINKSCRKAVDTATLSNAVSTRAAEFNALMKQYNDLKTNENNLDLTKVTIAKKPVISRSKALKLAIAGFIAGIVLSAALYILWLSMGAKVLSARDFNTVYGLRKLGVIPKEKSKRLGTLDKIILASDLRYQKVSSIEAGYENAVNNIESVLNGASSVSVISDLDSNKLESILTRLKERNDRIDYKIAGDISDPVGEKVLAESDNVMVIAEAMRSRYDVFDDLMQELRHSDKNILGSVIV